MIATHNSATGENGKGFLSKLVTISARCQSKTLVQQYNAGCRYFDLRVNHDKQGKLQFAHGFWTSTKDVHEALYELDMLAAIANEETYVSITFEGSLNTGTGRVWVKEMLDLMNRYNHLILAELNVKKPKWTCYYSCSNHPGTVQGFKSLDWSSWHTMLPIPWLWNKVFKRLREDRENTFVLVDFM